MSARRTTTFRTLFGLVAFLASACANMHVESSSFLGDFERLAPAPAQRVAFVPDEVREWRASGVNWSTYSNVLVREVEWRPVGARALAVDPKEAAKLCGDFRRILRDRLGHGMRVVDAPQPQTLEVRAALSDVATSNVPLNVLALIVLFPIDMGGIRGEVELLDASTREPLMALAAYREGTPLLVLECFAKYGHARHGMKKWALLLHDVVRPKGTDEPETSRNAAP